MPSTQINTDSLLPQTTFSVNHTIRLNENDTEVKERIFAIDKAYSQFYELVHTEELFFARSMPGGDRQTGGLPPGFNKFTAFTTATMPGDTIFFACRLSDPAKEKSFKQKVADIKSK